MFAEKLRLVADRITDILAGFVAFLPALVVALLVFLAGWVLARLFRLAVTRIPFKGSGGAAASGFFPGQRLSARELVGHFVFWFFLLVSTVLSFEVIGLPVGSGIVDGLLVTVPRIFVALIIFFFGFLLALLTEEVTRNLLERMGQPRSIFWSKILRWVTLLMVFLMAIEQLGLAAQFALWLILILVGAVAFAFALAFGLGCKDMARDMVIEFFKPEPAGGPEHTA